MRRLRYLLVGISLTFAAGCGGSGTANSSSNTPTGPTGTGANPSGSTSTSISVNDDFYSPSSTTIAVGSAVTWTWKGTQEHSVTFDDGQHSATQSSGTYTRTFSTTGTFAYHCIVHGQAMSGTVTVQ